MTLLPLALFGLCSKNTVRSSRVGVGFDNEM